MAVRMTVTFPPPPGAYIGSAACERDATLLRSQLEPYTTLQLRRRLVETFGHEPHSMFGAPPEARKDVMERLLQCYVDAGISEKRRLVRVLGTPVSPHLCAELLSELHAWSARYAEHQERPMISAEKYMIIRSPPEFEAKISEGSRTATTAEKKYTQNRNLWNAAAAAMETVDPGFAASFTGLAVTQGFKGSPHIDTVFTLIA